MVPPYPACKVVPHESGRSIRPNIILKKHKTVLGFKGIFQKELR